MHASQILIALGILALVASLMVCMFVDLERLRREIELDELWDDAAVGADGGLLWASSGTVSADETLGGVA